MPNAQLNRCARAHTHTHTHTRVHIHTQEQLQYIISFTSKFAHRTNSPNWETLAPRRKLSRICALFKVYSGERAWKPIGDRLQWPHYLSRVDHERKIRTRRQRKDIGKYSFVNRTIQHWNQLPSEVLGNLPCKPITFKKRVGKIIVALN